jgi:hypothetical protein
VNVFTNDMPLYALDVAVLRKGDGVPLARWVDSITKAENDSEPNADLRMAPADTVTVGTESGYLLTPDCGDCRPRMIFVAKGTKVVRLSYVISSNEPLGMIKDGVYGLLLSPFRWDPP